MAELLTDCPRCGSKKTTFDVLAEVQLPLPKPIQGAVRPRYEIFAKCRHCKKPTTFEIGWTSIIPAISELQGYIDQWVSGLRAAAVIPQAAQCPEHVPAAIKRTFDEAAKCLAIQCYDASGTMFRKVLDSATRPLLPSQPDPEDKSHPDFIAWKIRKDLALRLNWLFERGKLPESIRDLAECVREDGNDAAHSVQGITKLEAADLQDFTILVLETLYTLPGQIAENRRRRAERRGDR